jgi:hypothetical protein
LAAASFRLAYPIVAVHDLYATAECYARIGFAVGPEQREAAGLVQRTVRFADNALVLMALEDAPKKRRRDCLYGIVAERLAVREGVAALALHGTAGAIAALGERDIAVVRRVLPDAAHPGLAFVLADSAEGSVMAHPNSASRVLRVTYAAADPDAVRPRFRAIWRGTTAHPDGFEMQTASGTLRVLSNDAAANHFLTADMPVCWTTSPGVVAITLMADRSHELVAGLYREHVPHSVYARSVRIDAAFAGNVVLEFVYPALLRQW